MSGVNKHVLILIRIGILISLITYVSNQRFEGQFDIEYVDDTANTFSNAGEIHSSLVFYALSNSLCLSL